MTVLGQLFRFIINIFTENNFILQLEFTPADVIQPEMTSMLTTCVAKGHPLLLDYSNFTDPDHYSIIMGYDKPMNFQLASDAPVEMEVKKTKKN